MHLNSILLFIFPFLININYSFCLWKKSKDTLDNYIIDILFTNSLTIIRCNPYERQILRDTTIETIGHIKCSNRNLFLPDNHIEGITLLQWDYTSIKCNKQKTVIKEEKTYLNIKHKPKNAFKKLKLELIRVGSTGPSELQWIEKISQLYFKHPPRQLSISNTEQKIENFSTEIYSFKNRPIICRERKLSFEEPCSNTNQYQNFSYVCYYKIGVSEPPTIAEMEKELKTLPNNIHLDEDSKVEFYVDKTPQQKSSWSILSIIAIFIIIFIIIIVGIVIYCCYCRSEIDEQNEEIIRVNSNTSIASNIS